MQSGYRTTDKPVPAGKPPFNVPYENDPKFPSFAAALKTRLNTELEKTPKGFFSRYNPFTSKLRPTEAEEDRRLRAADLVTHRSAIPHPNTLPVDTSHLGPRPVGLGPALEFNNWKNGTYQPSTPSAPPPPVAKSFGSMISDAVDFYKAHKNDEAELEEKVQKDFHKVDKKENPKGMHFHKEEEKVVDAFHDAEEKANCKKSFYKSMFHPDNYTTNYNVRIGNVIR